MKVLAHIREQYSLSLGSYGRPRMTMELKEVGLDVGAGRVGRLMKVNGIKPVRTRKHKVTTDSHYRLGVATNGLDGDFAADAPIVNGQATSPISGPQKVGSTLPSFSTCIAAVSWAGPSVTG